MRPFLGVCNGLNGGLVLIEPGALGCMAEYRQKTKSAAEAGGILLGYRRGPHLHVTHATEPAQNDQRSRFSFTRAADYHQRVAMTLWHQSGGTIDYLGEWHTHPQKDPQPSSIDLPAWQLICDSRQVPMLFIILGMDAVHWFGIHTEAGFERLLPTVVNAEPAMR